MSEVIGITIEQLDDMKHAIGYNKKNVRHGKYEAYRNFYTTETVNESWQQLIEKGYAIGGRCRRVSGDNAMVYSVSAKWLELMENLLDIKIVETD